MKSIKEALDWLNNLLKFGIKPGLERMEWMLERLNHPERRLKTIHIAGTNGKGSTTEYLTQMLMQAGQEIGTFTSPHLIEVTDRIAVNGNPITDDDFVQLANDIRPLVEELGNTEYGQATEFEVMTIIAIQYFATIAYPDIVIVETGLGGRLDSTNIVHPMLSIITNVSYDHTDILGDSLEAIAYEKAGIIKSGVPVITGATGEAIHIINKVAKEKLSKCYRYRNEFTSKNEVSHPNGEQFDYQSPFLTRESLFIHMKGKHQIQNASLALMALDYLYFFFGLTVETEDLKAGLKATSLKGRFEQVSEQPLIILDGAHNDEATACLAKTISDRYPNKNINIIFSALETKDVKKMIANVEKVANKITFASFSHPKALPADKLYSYSNLQNSEIANDLPALLDDVLQTTSESTVTIVTGSLNFITEVRKLLK